MHSFEHFKKLKIKVTIKIIKNNLVMSILKTTIYNESLDDIQVNFAKEYFYLVFSITS